MKQSRRTQPGSPESKKPETRQELVDRVQRAVQHCQDNFRMIALCASFPRRLRELKRANGRNLKY